MVRSNRRVLQALRHFFHAFLTQDPTSLRRARRSICAVGYALLELTGKPQVRALIVSLSSRIYSTHEILYLINSKQQNKENLKMATTLLIILLFLIESIGGS